MRKTIAVFTTGLVMLAGASGELAAKKKKEPPVLAKCEQSLGTIALVDGDLAGWSKYGLGSPRALINSLAIESGCFTPQGASGDPARFLITAVAGKEEEVDQSVNIAKAGATEALVRSGAAGRALGGVPFAGSALGLFGGLGGKKKVYAAGLKVVSPANGMTLVSGTGVVKKSSISFGNSGGFGWASNAASAAGYRQSKDGRKLAEAFILAFNQIIAQRAILGSAPAAGKASPQTHGAIVAADTVMRGAASKEAAILRELRAGTELNPTGAREGLFVEVSDNFGTKGWVSVEDLK